MPDYTVSNIRVTEQWKKFKGFKIDHTHTKALLWHDSRLNPTMRHTVQSNGYNILLFLFFLQRTSQRIRSVNNELSNGSKMLLQTKSVITGANQHFGILLRHCQCCEQFFFWGGGNEISSFLCVLGGGSIMSAGW